MASARGLARFYEPLACKGRVDGKELVQEQSLEGPQRRSSWSAMDAVLRRPMGFSYGFVKEDGDMFSPNLEAFGHPGAGGSLGWADPVEALSIGYVCNRMDFRIRSPRALALCHALYASLEAMG